MTDYSDRLKINRPKLTVTVRCQRMLQIEFKINMNISYQGNRRRSTRPRRMFSMQINTLLTPEESIIPQKTAYSKLFLTIQLTWTPSLATACYQVKNSAFFTYKIYSHHQNNFTCLCVSLSINQFEVFYFFSLLIAHFYQLKSCLLSFSLD